MHYNKHTEQGFIKAHAVSTLLISIDEQLDSLLEEQRVFQSKQIANSYPQPKAQLPKKLTTAHDENPYSPKAVLRTDSGSSSSSPITPIAYPSLKLPNCSLASLLEPQRAGKRKKESLVAPLTSIENLQESREKVVQVSYDPEARITWCRDVLLLVDLDHNFASPLVSDCGRIKIQDEQLASLFSVAMPLILGIANSKENQTTQCVSQARYIRGILASTGAFPDYVPRNKRSAFRDFEAAANGGCYDAWFRLGRDYEKFENPKRARTCFERGVRRGSGCCAYRMGMAYLIGQLGLEPSPALAAPLLYRAARLASLDFPYPAYVYALLLTSEFEEAEMDPEFFMPFVPKTSTFEMEAKRFLEHAAYLHCGPAQYKLGHAYEFGYASFQRDPMLSIQYYGYATKSGEAEAALALSRWFLCGSGVEGGFEKDEDRALTFVVEAARLGLACAEFAMGYYLELGIGTYVDLRCAVEWYTMAMEHGNMDAKKRLDALLQSTPRILTRRDHDLFVDQLRAGRAS